MSTIPVYVRVQNNFGTTAEKIQLWHEFSSNPTQYWSWSNVPPNGGATTYVTANGSTASGHDYWQIIVTLNGGTVWEHTSWKTCTIESADKYTYQTQVVSPSYWSIPLNSGGCTTTLSQVGAAAAASAQLEPEKKKAPSNTSDKPAKKR